MEKFIIRYNTNSQNDTSTETVSEQANVAEGDDGEPKAKKRNPGEENSQTRTKPKVRKFQSKWFVGRSWLKYDPVKNVMACKYCEQFDKQKQTSLSQGSSTFKLETLRKHEVSEMHSMCQEAYVASTLPPASSPIEKGFQKMDEIELEKRKKQFTTAFFVGGKTIHRLCKIVGTPKSKFWGRP